MARRNPPKADETPANWSLSPQQEMAMELLFSGKNLTETAQAVGVTRQTVSEWYNHHAGFIATLNSKRLELWGSAQERLRGMVPTAIDVLEHELLGENRLQAAIHLLKITGLYSLPAPGGLIDPAALAKEMTQTPMERLMDSLAY